MTCPHCGAGHLDRGATGLDLCTRCGGLSRGGQPLPANRRFRAFDTPGPPEAGYLYAHGVVVSAVALEDGATGIAVAYVLDDGTRLPPIVAAGALEATFAQLVADAHAATVARGN